MSAWPERGRDAFSASIGRPRGGDRSALQSGICSSRPIIRRTRSCRRDPAIGRLAQALRPSRRTVTWSQICQHLLELVADEDDGSTPSSRSSPQQANRAVGLLRRQRGGRLVEQQHARAQRQRLGDLDELHLRDAELRDRRRAGRVEFEHVEPAPRLAR